MAETLDAGTLNPADEMPPTQVAVIGCGVIGSAWAARFRRAGVAVRAFDPSPNAARILDEVEANAATAWAELGLPPVTPGDLTVCASVAEAVDGAQLVQESVPERLEIKASTLAAIEEAASTEAVIASSTSGFRPTVLAEGLAHPERLIVAHPFNPVYLLPLVEVVGGEATTAAVLEQAQGWYRSVGMRPLHVRTEIDAFIADRLLEAVWREALWLVNDGVATTAEIDDAITYGFGLRWAQMGLFDTYRVAGGEGGMRQFIAQFGECLSWPWTKLMDTPELTDDLIDAVATQSDDQSGHFTIRELERARDRNLAAILRALEANEWGAGATLARQRAAVTTRLGS
ncbi:MAG: 3-hydroxyacyl-CoA dehydrogenase NAD-binding domain-containing protein [Actinomycetota bacterium]